MPRPNRHTRRRPRQGSVGGGPGGDKPLSALSKRELAQRSRSPSSSSGMKPYPMPEHGLKLVPQRCGTEQPRDARTRRDALTVGAVLCWRRTVLDMLGQRRRATRRGVGRLCLTKRRALFVTVPPVLRCWAIASRLPATILPTALTVRIRNHRRPGSQSSDGRAQNDCNRAEGVNPQSLRLGR